MSARKHYGGFTLVELLVVIGIIAMLVAILMPSLSRAKRSAQRLVCQSNLRQCGMYLIMYSNENKGFMFPSGLGSNIVDPNGRWPVFVFKPPEPNPKVMICPDDHDLGLEDVKFGDTDAARLLNKHSYVLNKHLVYEGIRYTRTQGVPAETIVVMGEKKREYCDYYMEVEWDKTPPLSDYDRMVEENRHGLKHGSNLLYLDGHVDNQRWKIKTGCVDAWQVVIYGTSI
jgi:prepilin-type N-terminal cleavage/methylation domain-containing protein/prepilin-type processing-associated H-X9-DG protein